MVKMREMKSMKHILSGLALAVILAVSPASGLIPREQGIIIAEAASQKEKALSAYKKALETNYFCVRDGDSCDRADSFCILDLDKDTVPELLVKCYLNGGGWGGTKGYLVYTYRNDTVQRIGVVNGGESSTSAYYYKNAKLLLESWTRWEIIQRVFWKMDSSSALMKAALQRMQRQRETAVSYYSYGQPVTESQYNSLLKSAVGSEKGVDVEKLLKKNSAANRKKYLVSSKSSIKLNKGAVTLKLGKTSSVKLKAAVTGASGKVKWSSSNKKVATVSSSGKVKAKKKGTAVITARIGNRTAKCKVTVKKGTATSKKPGSVSKQTTGYQKISSKKKKIGSYYMWIDGQCRLHIKKSSAKKELAVVTGCDAGVSNGRVIYYIKKTRSGAWLSKYSISDKKEQLVAFLEEVNDIAGAYKNRLILSSGNGIYDGLYAYDVNKGKMKKISYSCKCAGKYKQYFVFEGVTGAVTSVHVGVYNSKTNQSKTLTNDSWYMVQNGNQIYYAQDEGGDSSKYTVRKLRIYKYTITTGKTKAVSKTVTVSVLGRNKLTKNNFTYYGVDGKKHTLRF